MELTPEQAADLALLDMFACAALPPLLLRNVVSIDAKEVSKAAYEMAQAMLDRHKAYQPG